MARFGTRIIPFWITSPRNGGIPFDEERIHKPVCEAEVKDYAKELYSKETPIKGSQITLLLQAVECLDLTFLSARDTGNKISQLCSKAVDPISKEIFEKLEQKGVEINSLTGSGITKGCKPYAAAVCVHRAQITNCRMILEPEGVVWESINFVKIAGGFPLGQYEIKSRLREMEPALRDDAVEIDIVINRDLALCGNWKEVYEQVKAMRAVCNHDAIIKTSLSIDDLGSLDNVYTASVVCMMAGTDFICTSTGKEDVMSDTLPAGVVMARAIKEYFEETGHKVGLKAVGGIRTVEDVLAWQSLVENVLGTAWWNPYLFRIGANRLLGGIEEYLSAYVEQ